MTSPRVQEESRGEAEERKLTGHKEEERGRAGGDIRGGEERTAPGE